MNNYNKTKHIGTVLVIKIFGWYVQRKYFFLSSPIAQSNLILACYFKAYRYFRDFLITSFFNEHLSYCIFQCKSSHFLHNMLCDCELKCSRGAGSARRTRCGCCGWWLSTVWRSGSLLLPGNCHSSHCLLGHVWRACESKKGNQSEKRAQIFYKK